MSENGALITARRSVGASAVQSRTVARRPVVVRSHGLLALAVMAVGVTGATWQQSSVSHAGVGDVQAQAVVAAVKAVVTAPAGGATPAMTIKAPAPEAAAAAAVSSPSALFAVLAHAEPSEQYYERVRSEMRWTPVRVGERKLATPDARSRLLLAKSAAEVADLQKVGLDFRDVYGVINAETTWVPRTGMGKNGVPSHGLAQFEPGTAKAMGLSNPNDPVEAVHAAAMLLKEAATWSSRRIAALDLTPEMHAVKLREGVSIYYNLSSKARRDWTGENTHTLPVETRRHIRNVRLGAAQAERLQERLVAGAPVLTQVNHVPAPAVAPPVRTGRAVERSSAKPQAQVASTARKQATPTAGARPVVVADRSGRKSWVLPQGSIAWSANG